MYYGVAVARTCMTHAHALMEPISHDRHTSSRAECRVPCISSRVQSRVRCVLLPCKSTARSLPVCALKWCPGLGRLNAGCGCVNTAYTWVALRGSPVTCIKMSCWLNSLPEDLGIPIPSPSSCPCRSRSVPSVSDKQGHTRVQRGLIRDLRVGQRRS
jgi:hypothetical protein